MKRDQKKKLSSSPSGRGPGGGSPRGVVDREDSLRPPKPGTSRKGVSKMQSSRRPRVSKGKTPIHLSSKDFSPTLGDIDLHLFGEGKHLRIYEKLGAHVLTHEGERGVAFAVWAPNAERVNVVGDFNKWDGSKHPMRPLKASGIWELFIPGLKAGEFYKYEIKSRSGPVFLKADPYAFMMEVPPDTSSIVFESKNK